MFTRILLGMELQYEENPSKKSIPVLEESALGLDWWRSCEISNHLMKRLLSQMDDDGLKSHMSDYKSYDEIYIGLWLETCMALEHIGKHIWNDHHGSQRKILAGN